MAWQVLFSWMEFERWFREIANRNLVERCSYGYKDVEVYSSEAENFKISLQTCEFSKSQFPRQLKLFVLFSFL